MIAIGMGEESHTGPHGTERYERWLAENDVPSWLHYEEARIDQLTRSEVNELVRAELRRRNNDRPIEDDPRRIWAWLFVSFVLREGVRADESGGEADG